MALLVQPIPVGARVFDTIGALTVPFLRAMKAAGGDGVIAYLGANLTAQAIADAAAEDLGIVPVNESRGEGWIPTAEIGTQDATRSAAAIKALGLPMIGLDDWCDVEGCGADPTAYAKAWCEVVAGDGSGRRAKSYEGAGALLSGAQWYALPFTGYWHSCSRAIPEPGCGFQLDQLFPPDQPLAGGGVVDFNFARRDFFGRAPSWVKSSG